MVSFDADCGNCLALCCVALPFARSADFPFAKAGGEPCRNLLADHRCSIHSSLREKGYRGCTVFHCLGAGPAASARTGLSSSERFSLFSALRQVHEMLWYLADALSRHAAAPLHARVRAEIARLENDTTPDDVAPHRARVGPLLGEVSELVRAQVPDRARDRRGADLIGASLRGASFRGASLRGAYLIGADLRDADLTSADLLGADLRDCDLRGATLTDALFLTPAQRNAAHLTDPPPR